MTYAEKKSNTGKTRDSKKIYQLSFTGRGAHGAFTWGVLDRILEFDRIEIAAISGTSAGAMNAVVLADGIMAGGKEGAREALTKFWRSVHEAAVMSPQRTPFDRMTDNWNLDYSPGYLLASDVAVSIKPVELESFEGIIDQTGGF
jgi:NTE family protein